MLKELLESEQKKQSLSTRELAVKANVSHTTVFRALQGKLVDLDTLIKLAAWLRVSPSTLLNSLAETEDSLPDKIAVIVERHPALRRTFEQAIKAIKNNEVDPDVIEDIVAYAAYKLNLAIKSH